MSLSKIVVVMVAAVALMPTDKEGQHQFLEKTSAATNWVVGFCDRNPSTCEKASNGADVLKQKASFAIETAMVAAQQYSEPPYARSAHYQQAAYQNINEQADTLTDLDKEPTWRGQ